MTGLPVEVCSVKGLVAEPSSTSLLVAVKMSCRCAVAHQGLHLRSVTLSAPPTVIPFESTQFDCVELQS